MFSLDQGEDRPTVPSVPFPVPLRLRDPAPSDDHVQEEATTQHDVAFLREGLSVVLAGWIGLAELEERSQKGIWPQGESSL